MKLSRRSALAGIAAAAARRAGSAGAQDGELGTKTIRMVVAYGAGSATDSLARYLAAQLGSGRRVVVDNRPGADGNIAAEAVARAGGSDIFLLVSGVSTHATNATIYRQLPYDPENDFTPLSMIAAAPYVLLVNPARIKAGNVGELVALSARDGRSLTYGSANVGGRLSGELFKKLSRIEAVNVAYRASAQAMTDLLGGQYDYYFCDAVTALPQVRDGKVKALAVTTRSPVPGLPDAPPLAEQGYPDFDISSWIAVWSARKNSPETSTRLATLVSEILDTPSARSFISGIGLVPLPTGPDKLRDVQKRDTELLRPLIIEAGMQNR